MLIIAFLLTSCNQINNANTKNKQAYAQNPENLLNKLKSEQQQQKTKKLSFKDVSEIIEDNSYSTWIELKNNTPSLALHFQYKGTLSISYSPECWLIYPYNLDGNKIVVFWDNSIDSKYDFDIVKAINKIDKKFIGKPFMILELVNDTTFKAIYPLKDLVRQINHSSKERTLFPNKYVLSQHNYL